MSKEKEGGKEEEDPEIDLELRPPFSTCSPTESPGKKKRNPPVAAEQRLGQND